ncbi:MAG: hypothetical protein D6760_13080 [Deltaproteobacteria bacterium]|nr:MAG: hypothetical protein D6760_13080 [Deltaproteobacteria bacterium]
MVLVPDVAVINTGKRAVAFVMAEPGRFQPREVRLGARASGNYVEVLSGLAPGEKVVVSGQFLLDSESNLREAAMKFLKPGKVSGAAPIKEATEKTTHADHEHRPDEGRLFYVCPMPEHADILYDAPGKCPICGMELVPVRRPAAAAGASARPAYWTCPMPEHASVHEDGPGKCPICGMTLIPVMEEGSGGNRGGSGEETPAERSPHPGHEHSRATEHKESNTASSRGEQHMHGMPPAHEHMGGGPHSEGMQSHTGGDSAHGAGSNHPAHGHGATDRERAVAYWTCPMPEHASVHEDGPGRCPLCGMELVPVPAEEATP